MISATQRIIGFQDFGQANNFSIVIINIGFRSDKTSTWPFVPDLAQRARGAHDGLGAWELNSFFHSVFYQSFLHFLILWRIMSMMSTPTMCEFSSLTLSKIAVSQFFQVNLSFKIAPFSSFSKGIRQSSPLSNAFKGFEIYKQY